MADQRPAPASTGPASGTPGSSAPTPRASERGAPQRPGRFAPYTRVLASRIASQSAYRASFAAMLFGSVMVALAEIGEVWAVFSNIDSLGGMTFAQVLVVFGLSGVSFTLVDATIGQLDRIPMYIRTGTIDAFYLRPVPVLPQLATSDIRLDKAPRVLIAAAILVLGLRHADVPHWGVAAAMIALALVCGALIFAAVFVWAAGTQFFIIDGAVATNAVVYGSRYASSQPASVFPGPVQALFTYLLPATFTGYLPALVILGIDGPPLMPSWLAWFLPLAAVLAWAVGLATWRAGIRHYQGAGG